MKPRFTLIELLVILAILAVLAAVLCPVIAQARITRIGNSLSDLRQQETAVKMYAQDYDEAVLLPTHSLIAARFKAGRPLAPFATGCITEATDGSWQSLNGGCEDMVSHLVWSRTSDETTGYYNRVYQRPPGDTRLPGAWDYCHTLAQGSCPDQPDGLCHGWRLPTKDEAVLAASHHLTNYAPMRFPTTWGRAADPSWLETTGKNKGNYYIYGVKLGTGEWGPALWKDKTGNYEYSVGDTICVRTP